MEKSLHSMYKMVLVLLTVASVLSILIILLLRMNNDFIYQNMHSKGLMYWFYAFLMHFDMFKPAVIGISFLIIIANFRFNNKYIDLNLDLFISLLVLFLAIFSYKYFNVFFFEFSLN